MREEPESRSQEKRGRMSRPRTRRRPRPRRFLRGEWRCEYLAPPLYVLAVRGFVGTNSQIEDDDEYENDYDSESVASPGSRILAPGSSPLTPAVAIPANDPTPSPKLCQPDAKRR
jgi:hypothetical protein